MKLIVSVNNIGDLYVDLELAQRLAMGASVRPCTTTEKVTTMNVMASK
ncbi:MAG: hypothetical protein JO303_08045, partial [Caulobacteraceae bacterium]|nr:hypothetical protein [Caulobacteraceae bacterium]